MILMILRILIIFLFGQNHHAMITYLSLQTSIIHNYTFTLIIYYALHEPNK